MAMIFVFVITSEYIIIYEESIFIFLPRVLLEFVLCAASYLGVTYIIDKNTRSFFKTVISEFIGKKHE